MNFAASIKESSDAHGVSDINPHRGHYLTEETSIMFIKRNFPTRAGGQYTMTAADYPATGSSGEIVTPFSHSVKSFMIGIMGKPEGLMRFTAIIPLRYSAAFPAACPPAGHSGLKPPCLSSHARIRLTLSSTGLVPSIRKTGQLTMLSQLSA